MKEVAQLLLAMRAAGVISEYALFGAVAQMRYTEAVATLDADVLVALAPSGGLDILKPIYDFCAARGFHPEGEGVRVGAWPVQFIPAFNPLTWDALHQAEVEEFEGAPLRVVSATYLAVIALSTGRPKDRMRILALIEAGRVTPEAVGDLAGRYGLSEAWRRFKTRFLDD